MKSAFGENLVEKFFFQKISIFLRWRLWWSWISSLSLFQRFVFQDSISRLKLIIHNYLWYLKKPKKALRNLSSVLINLSRGLLYDELQPLFFDSLRPQKGEVSCKEFLVLHNIYFVLEWSIFEFWVYDF